MRVRLNLVIFFILAIVSGCGKKVVVEDLSLLHVVPSDAVSLAYYSSCDTCLARMVDSTDTFRSIELGALACRPAVFSYNSSSALIPMLAIDAGEELSGECPGVDQIVESLPSLGFRYRCLSVCGCRILVISRSEELLSAVSFHIESGESILSSAGFSEAFRGPDAVYVRNSTVAPLVKAMYPQDREKRNYITGQLKDACEWLALKDVSGGEYELFPSCPEDARYFINVFNGLGSGVSLLPLPEDTDSFVDLVLCDWRKYRENFEKYLDSDNKLVPVKKQKAWAEGFEPLEVAKIVWDGSEVLLARGKKMPQDTTAVSANSIQKYIPALFGNALGIEDESCTAYAGGWLVIGSAEDIEKYLNLNKTKTLPEKDVLAKVKIGPEGTLCWKKQGIKLFVY